MIKNKRGISVRAVSKLKAAMNNAITTKNRQMMPNAVMALAASTGNAQKRMLNTTGKLNPEAMTLRLPAIKVSARMRGEHLNNDREASQKVADRSRSTEAPR